MKWRSINGINKRKRKYLGLELIEPDWERVEIPSNCLKPELSTGKNILFFGGGYEKRGELVLANYTTQKTYFSSAFAGLPDMNVDDFKVFLISG